MKKSYIITGVILIIIFAIIVFFVGNYNSLVSTRRRGRWKVCRY